MVVEKVIMGARWLNGKWIKAAAETVSNSAHKGSWINGKWVKETPRMFEEGKVYSKMKTTSTTSIPREFARTRLPEGMLPEEMSMADIRALFNSRYKAMRYGDKRVIRSASPEQIERFHSAIKSKPKNILIDDEVDWIYRKPLTMTDRIQDFKIIPQERVSMNINAEPELISALDRYISTGEVIVNGKLAKKVKPPKAYYKVDTCLDKNGSFWNRTDPITMYFRESATPEQLSDIIQITKSFSCSTPVTFPNGALKGASWLSHAKEHSPEDLYKLYKRALRIDSKLAEAVETKVTKSGYGRISGIDYGKDLPYIERYRYRMSEGQYQAVESVVNDYAKALGKTHFDTIM